MNPLSPRNATYYVRNITPANQKATRALGFPNLVGEKILVNKFKIKTGTPNYHAKGKARFNETFNVARIRNKNPNAF